MVDSFFNLNVLSFAATEQSRSIAVSNRHFHNVLIMTTNNHRMTKEIQKHKNDKIIDILALRSFQNELSIFLITNCQ